MKIREGWIENLENVLRVLNCSSKIRLSDYRRTQLSLQHFPYKVALNHWKHIYENHRVFVQSAGWRTRLMRLRRIILPICYQLAFVVFNHFIFQICCIDNLSVRWSGTGWKALWQNLVVALALCVLPMCLTAKGWVSLAVTFHIRLLISWNSYLYQSCHVEW